MSTSATLATRALVQQCQRLAEVLADALGASLAPENLEDGKLEVNLIQVGALFAHRSRSIADFNRANFRELPVHVLSVGAELRPRLRVNTLWPNEAVTVDC